MQYSNKFNRWFARRWQLACWTSLLLFLSGCATIETSESSLSTEPSQHTSWMQGTEPLAEKYLRLTNLASFRLDAKIAVKVDDRQDSANLIWQSDSPEMFKLTVFGAFGAGTTTLEVGQRWARATDAKGHQYEDANPQRLLYKLTGWVVPVRELQFWLFGLAYPNSDMRYRLDKQGFVTELQQANWTIDYQGSLASMPNDDWLLPKRLLIQSRQLDQDISIKLVSKKWQIN